MAKTVLGIFSSRLDAEAAVDDLENVGYSSQDISIMMKDEENPQQETEVTVTDSTVSGAVTGGIIGGIAGLLVGIAAIVVPGIGALLIGGPLAAALGASGVAGTAVSGVATGLLAGGIIGALVGLGIPQEEAKAIEAHIKKGGILIAVPAEIGEEQEVSHLMEDNSATLIRILDTDLPEKSIEEVPRVYEETQYLFVPIGTKGGKAADKKRKAMKSSHKKKK